MEILKFVFIFFIFISISQAANYLTEKPDFLKSCRLHGNPDKQCLKEDMQNLFKHWKAGIPGLKKLGALDPFKVKKLRLHQSTEVIDLQLEMRNVLVSGIGDAKVTHASMDENYEFHNELYVPLSKLKSDYKLKGRVLVLNLDGLGQMEMDLTDTIFTVSAKSNLVKRGEEYFFDVKSINTSIKNIGNFRIHLSNLFNGNTELENSAHELFNGNWRTLYEALRPGLTQTFDAILLDRYRRVFQYLPARFFISDLP